MSDEFDSAKSSQDDRLDRTGEAASSEAKDALDANQNLSEGAATTSPGEPSATGGLFGTGTPRSTRPTAAGLPDQPETISLVRSNILASLNISRPEPLAVEPREAEAPVPTSDPETSTFGQGPTETPAYYPRTSTFDPGTLGSGDQPAAAGHERGETRPLDVYSAPSTDPAIAGYSAAGRHPASGPSESQDTGNLSDTSMFSSVVPADISEGALSEHALEGEQENQTDEHGSGASTPEWFAGGQESSASTQGFSANSQDWDAGTDAPSGGAQDWRSQLYDPKAAAESAASAPTAYEPVADEPTASTGSQAYEPDTTGASSAAEATLAEDSSPYAASGVTQSEAAVGDSQPSTGMTSEAILATDQPELDQKEGDVSTPGVSSDLGASQQPPVYPAPTFAQAPATQGAYVESSLTASPAAEPAQAAAWAPPTPPEAGAVEAGTDGGLQSKVRDLAAERPEVVLAAAFAGGILLATILRRLARR